MWEADELRGGWVLKLAVGQSAQGTKLNDGCCSHIAEVRPKVSLVKRYLAYVQVKHLWCCLTFASTCETWVSCNASVGCELAQHPHAYLVRALGSQRPEGPLSSGFSWIPSARTASRLRAQPWAGQSGLHPLDSPGVESFHTVAGSGFRALAGSYQAQCLVAKTVTC